jgi:regulatory protein
MKNISSKEKISPIRSPRQRRGIRPHQGRITSNGVKKAKDYAFKLLSYRPRSVKEIEDRLKKKDYASKIIFEVVRNLKKLKFLNDKEFARMWVESRIKTRPMGRYRLKQELIQKGIDKDLIEKTLSNYREEEEIELAKELAQRKLKRSYQDLDEITTKRRLYGFLQRRGFSYDTIQEAMKEIRRAENERE